MEENVESDLKINWSESTTGKNKSSIEYWLHKIYMLNNLCIRISVIIIQLLGRLHCTWESKRNYDFFEINIREIQVTKIDFDNCMGILFCLFQTFLEFAIDNSGYVLCLHIAWSDLIWQTQFISPLLHSQTGFVFSCDWFSWDVYRKCIVIS